MVTVKRQGKAPYWQMGRPFLHPSQPSVYCVEADPVSMCKLASGHFSLKVCPFRYFSQPLGTQASTATLRRKGRALRGVSGGHSYPGRAAGTPATRNRAYPASLLDVWDGMTFAFRTAFFVLKELAWLDVGERTPELLYQLHSVVCPQLGARTEHMGHGEPWGSRCLRLLTHSSSCSEDFTTRGVPTGWWWRCKPVFFWGGSTPGATATAGQHDW